MSLKDEIALTNQYPYQKLSADDGDEVTVTRKARVPGSKKETQLAYEELADAKIEEHETRDAKKDYDVRANRAIKRLEGVTIDRAMQAKEGSLQDVEHIEQKDRANNRIRVYRVDTEPPVCVFEGPLDDAGQGDLFPENKDEGGEDTSLDGQSGIGEGGGEDTTTGDPPDEQPNAQ